MKYIYTKISASLLFIVFCPIILLAQNNVGINTTTPNSNAAMEIKAVGFQGFLMPRFPASDTSNFSLASKDVGLMFFDTFANEVLFWTGTKWKIAGGSASSPALVAQNGLTYSSGVVQMGGSFLNNVTINTDLGGLAFQGTTGKSITINNTGGAGSIALDMTTGTDYGILVVNNKINGNAISGTNSSTGVGVYAANTGTGTALYSKSNGGYAGIFTGGNVGIGNTSPSYPLDVTGNARISGLVGPGNVVADAAGLLSISTATYLSSTGATTDNTVPFWSSGALSGSSIMNSDANSVSIGTALNSAYKLFVNETSATGTAFYAKSAGGYAGIFTGGNVGIGNTAPSYPLDVTGNARISGLVGPGNVVADAAGLLSISTATYLSSTGATTDNTVPFWSSGALSGSSIMNSDANSVSIGTALNSAYKLFVNETSATGTAFYAKSAGGYAGIFTGGNVGIGNTAPSYPLDVTGNARISGLVGPGNVVADAAGLLSISTATYLSSTGVTTDNTVPFWTGGALSASSVMSADATSVSIGNALNNLYKLYVVAKTITPAVYIDQNLSGAAVQGNANGAGNAIVGYSGSGNALYGQSLGTGSSVYADQKGTGIAMFANAQSLTGTAFYAKSNGGYAGIFTGGNVGIGNLTPSYTLDVTGSARISSLAGPGVVVTNAAGVLSISTKYVASTAAGIDNTVPFWTSGSLSSTSVLNSDATSVSIGAALDNTFKLYVTANTTTSAFYTRQNGNGNAIQGNTYGTGDAIVGLATNGNAIYGRSSGTGSSVYADQTGTGIAMYANAQSATGTAFFAQSNGGYAGILMGGNVGIGTSTPSAKLHIASSSSPAFRLVDGTQANGYVLTSDASGNASWQNLAPKIAFKATSAASQTIPKLALTQLTYDGVDFNDGSAYTGSQFKAPSAGVYHFDASCLFNPLSTPGRVGLHIYLNGTYVSGGFSYGITDFVSTSSSITLKLAAGDIITCYVYQNTNASQTLVSGQTEYNYFTGFKVY